MKFYLAMMIILIAAGCGETESRNKEEIVAVIEDPVISFTSYAGCHQMVIDKDTAYMSLQAGGDSLYGPLEYNRFEKDSNKGTVILKEKNNKLEGWYRFQSEGMNSVRQIIFKMNGDSLSEAYGDIEMKADTAMYKYPQTLQFEEKHSFKKTNCK